MRAADDGRPECRWCQQGPGQGRGPDPPMSAQPLALLLPADAHPACKNSIDQEAGAMNSFAPKRNSIGREISALMRCRPLQKTHGDVAASCGGPAHLGRCLCQTCCCASPGGATVSQVFIRSLSTSLPDTVLVSWVKGSTPETFLTVPPFFLRGSSPQNEGEIKAEHDGPCCATKLSPKLGRHP